MRESKALRPTDLILQLDFDGTLTRADVNEALFRHFGGEEWSARIEAASHELRREPSSPALVRTLQAASKGLTFSEAECLAYAKRTAPPREGIGQLVGVAIENGFEIHVVSYGFDFYVLDYLREAGVDEQVAVHCGETSRREDNGIDLRYVGPHGEAVTHEWKMRWTRHFLGRGASIVYAGDGGSDVAPAQLCEVVFARDSLLRGMPSTYQGVLRSFETLHDIARGLEELFGPPPRE